MKDNWRLDFTMEVLETDDATRTAKVVLVPRPDRYEWKEIDGHRYLFDRLDNALIPEEEFKKMAAEYVGQPIYCQPVLIDDIEAYVESRKTEISRHLQDDVTKTAAGGSEAELLELIHDTHDFVVASIDVVGSTKLVQTMETEKYARLMSALLYEVGELLPRFRGNVLKNVGDGVIAFFAPPSFLSKNDLAVQAAMAARVLLEKAFNPVAASLGYPAIELRIGIDSGEAYVTVIGNPAGKQEADILGEVVNLAVKVQSLAAPGDLVVGDTTLRNLHTTIRVAFEAVSLPGTWQYIDAKGEPYKVHRLATVADVTEANATVTS